MYKVTLKKIKIFLLGFFVLGLTSMYSVSFAQMQIELQEQDINVEVSPNNPQPYQDVTITLSSYSVDLNKAIISWKEDGVNVSSDIGKTDYSFKTKGPDIPIVIDIGVKVVGSMNTINKKITLVPSELELMWESADGYTPPFYKGKSLPIIGGFIKVVAIPNTKTITQGNGNITYTWSNGGSVIQEASGYNKNSYTFKNSMFDNVNEISVIASSVSENYNAENGIEIPVYKPQIVFYKKSPTEGILYNNALNKESPMVENEMTIVAEPYFFSKGQSGSDFSYNWQINGKSINTPLKPMELTIRPSARGGIATIDLTIDNLNELFQKVSNQLKLIL